jgi:hypothetical protein
MMLIHWLLFSFKWLNVFPKYIEKGRVLHSIVECKLMPTKEENTVRRGNTLDPEEG